MPGSSTTLGRRDARTSPTSAVSNGGSSSFNDLAKKLALHFCCAWRDAQALWQAQTEAIK